MKDFATKGLKQWSGKPNITTLSRHNCIGSGEFAPTMLRTVSLILRNQAVPFARVAVTSDPCIGLAHDDNNRSAPQDVNRSSDSSDAEKSSKTGMSPGTGTASPLISIPCFGSHNEIDPGECPGVCSTVRNIPLIASILP